MKKIILAATLLAPLAASAQPSSQVAWTVEQLNFVKTGNAQKGKELAQTCAACHGENGVSPVPGFPSLAGQLPTYTFKQLQDYGNGDRQHDVMTGIAKRLSKQDTADLAAWFASLPAASKPSSVNYDKAANLVSKGNNERMLPPCEVCHAVDGKGQKMDIPALAGQNADYLSAALLAYQNGSRHNDIYGRMRTLAAPLTADEIKELGLYYQGMKK